MTEVQRRGWGWRNKFEHVSGFKVYAITLTVNVGKGTEGQAEGTITYQGWEDEKYPAKETELREDPSL